MPRSIGEAVSATHGRWGSPWVATLLMGGGGLLACLLDPHTLVLVLGNSNVVAYSGLCVAALTARSRNTPEGAGWRMPGFPAPPVFGLIFLGAIASFDAFDPAGRSGLLVTALTVAASLVIFSRLGWRV